MKNFKVFFFKYHRLIGLILSIPLLLTALTGLGILICFDWLHNKELGELMVKIHTGEIFGIEEIYSIIVSLGLVWLVVSGLVASGLFKKKK